MIFSTPRHLMSDGEDSLLYDYSRSRNSLYQLFQIGVGILHHNQTKINWKFNTFLIVAFECRQSGTRPVGNWSSTAYISCHHQTRSFPVCLCWCDNANKPKSNFCYDSRAFEIRITSQNKTRQHRSAARNFICPDFGRESRKVIVIS